MRTLSCPNSLPNTGFSGFSNQITCVDEWLTPNAGCSSLLPAMVPASLRKLRLDVRVPLMRRLQ
jgi:hypothetical protein